ncbi:MAG: response regulator transcription factor [Chloroflexi bacterium]|nr:response regulator transcription factor [Chloroflexota bacterium]
MEPASAAITVLIVDDDARVRESLRALLALDRRLQVVGEAASVAEAVTLAATLRPSVVLLDLELDTTHGLALLGRWRREGLPVIALAVYPDTAAEALAAGASTCLLKDVPRQCLLAAIHRAHTQRMWPGHRCERSS